MTRHMLRCCAVLERGLRRLANKIARWKAGPFHLAHQPHPPLSRGLSGFYCTRYSEVGVRCDTRASSCTPFCGSTTTLAPTCTRLNRSMMSALRSRMQPDDTCLPIVLGALVP